MFLMCAIGSAAMAGAVELVISGGNRNASGTTLSTTFGIFAVYFLVCALLPA